MYSRDNNPGINWKDLIIKVIFIFLFVLLLMWLFKKSTPNMTPFYSNVFRENIKYMQDAAESYYTNERLPKNIGDTAEITLGEMIKKNMILEFVDKDGNSCDTEESYVQVVKNKDDYTLKVNLVCPTEKNYIEKTLGCYDYCEDCDKETTVTEYQFKQATSKTNVSYTCPNGGTLKDGVCYVYGTNSYKATEVTSVSKNYCPDGGTLSSDGKTCKLTKTETYTALTKVVSKKGYTCPDGGELDGDRCYIEDSYKVYKTPTYNYTCPSGYSLSGTTCYKTATTEGSTYAATKVTSKSTTSTYAATYGKTYKYGTFTSKPSGYTCSTSKQYVCSSSSNCPGYVTVYTSCYKSAYSCPNGGTLNGTKCTITKAGTTSYTCPDGGTLSGTTCKVSGSTFKVTMPATKSYTCSSGYKLSGTKCYKTKYDEYSYKATYEEEVTKTYCKDGSEPKDNKCTLTKDASYASSKTTATKSYSCPNGGTLDTKTNTCNTSVLKSKYNATKVSKVSNGYIYKWSTSETLEGWTRTGATREVEKTN